METTSTFKIEPEELPLFADLVVCMVFIMFSTYVSPESCITFIETWNKRNEEANIGTPEMREKLAGVFMETLAAINSYVQEMRK